MQFSLAGRILAVLTTIAFAVAGILQIGSYFELGLYCIFMCPVVGLIEMPLFCGCFKWCQVVSKYMKYIAGWWWIRGCIFIGLSAGGYAIYEVKGGSIWQLIVFVALTTSAAIYFVATFKGEPNPAYQLLLEAREKSKAAEASSTESTATEKKGFWQFGKSKDKETPKDDKKGANAFKTNESPFRDPERAVSKEPTKEDKARMFSGSMFGSGGGKSKYGYGDDIPEANPFVSS